jgi:hypothetical protein
LGSRQLHLVSEPQELERKEDTTATVEWIIVGSEKAGFTGALPFSAAPHVQAQDRMADACAAEETLTSSYVDLSAIVAPVQDAAASLYAAITAECVEDGTSYDDTGVLRLLALR